MLTVDISSCERICTRPASAINVSSLLISCTISFIVVHPLRRPQHTAWPKSCHCHRIGFHSRRHRHYTACIQHPRTCLFVGLHYSVTVSAICRTLCLLSDIGIMLHKCKSAEILRQELSESDGECNDSFSVDWITTVPSTRTS